MARRFLWLLLATFGLGAVGVFTNMDLFRAAFTANPTLNTIIFSLFGVGVVLLVRQIKDLQREVQWVIGYREGRPRVSGAYYPKLLAPLAVLVGQREQIEMLTADMSRTVLEVIRDRMDEKRGAVRYLVGLLIFLGLLGTFWGLLQTIGAISHVVGNLPTAGGDSILFFEQLKQGLKAPLGGMGIAFSSSMFGLAMSLILGFFDLQVNGYYRDFYQDIEEWLLGLSTRVGGAPVAETTTRTANPIFLNNLVEKLAGQLESLRQMVEQNTNYNAALGKNVLLLSERTATIADFMKTEQNLMLKIAEHQLELQSLLKSFHEDLKSGAAGINDLTQTHIRNLDVTLTQLTNQLHTDQARGIAEICGEIRLLTKTIASQAQADSTKIAI